MQRLWLVVGFQGKKDLENILALDLFQSNGNRYHERKWRQIKWNKARLSKKLTYCTPNLFGSIFFEVSFWFLKTLSFTCQYIFPALLRKFCIKSEYLGTDFAYEMRKYKWKKNYCVEKRVLRFQKVRNGTPYTEQVHRNLTKGKQYIGWVFLIGDEQSK